MTAALEEGAQWWDDSAHPVNADGKAGRDELARACVELWLASIRTYYTDAATSKRGAKFQPDNGEALADLLGSRELLANLCRPLDACPQRVGDAFIDALDAGRRFDTGAMNRPVVERPEDYRLGAWRERTKRRGKPQPITLG